MKKQRTKPAVETKKIASITILSIMAMLIILFGVTFSAYSLLFNISFSVMNSSIHGAVFGVVITFLGVRYFLSVLKLKKEVYKSSSQFSWNNFKSDKTNKTGNPKNEPILTKYWMRG